MPYNEPFNPLTPAGTDPVGEGAARIREVKAALIERLDTYYTDFPAGDPLIQRAGRGRILVGPTDDRPDPEFGLEYFDEETGTLYVGVGGPAWWAVGGGSSGGVHVATNTVMQRWTPFVEQVLGQDEIIETDLEFPQTSGPYLNPTYPNEFYVDSPGRYMIVGNLRYQLSTDGSLSGGFIRTMRVRRANADDPYVVNESFVVAWDAENLRSVPTNAVVPTDFMFATPTLRVAAGQVFRFKLTSLQPIALPGGEWKMKLGSKVELIRLGASHF